MAEGSWSRALLSSLTLRRSWGVLRGPMARSMVASIAMLYALGSMLLGGMLQLFPTGNQGRYVEFLASPNGDPAWWNYPAVIAVAPGGLLILPFFATIVMVVVSIGVGIGMTVGLVLVYRVIKDRRRNLGVPTLASTAAGLTPAMVCLVTLGACCSTIAAATAGIGVVAQLNGTSVEAVIDNSWFLGVFEVGVLWVALIAQEQLLSAFARFLPRAGAPIDGTGPAERGGAQTLRAWGAVAVRAALVVGGVTWSLAMFAEWISVDPSTAGAGEWTWWLLGHQVPAIFFVAVGLSSSGGLARLAELAHRRAGLPIRVLLLASGILLLGWFPSAVVATGLHGLLNEVLGVAGAPMSWGAASTGGVTGIALALRWGLQMLLLGLGAILFSILPEFLPTVLSAPPRSPVAATVTTPELRGVQPSASD
jgi:hypothetical protein